MSKPIVTIKIENLDEIMAAFKKAPELMRVALPKAINQSLLAIGREADKNLKAKVYETPISKSGYKRTGNLLSSILDPSRGLTLARTGIFEGSVGSGTNYGLFVEAGTKFMPARPFLKPAVDSTHEQVQNYFKNAVQDVLDDIARAT